MEWIKLAWCPYPSSPNGSTGTPFVALKIASVDRRSTAFSAAGRWSWFLKSAISGS
jgi:hypothetical protein